MLLEFRAALRAAQVSHNTWLSLRGAFHRLLADWLTSGRAVIGTEPARREIFKSGIYDRELLEVRLSDGTPLPCWVYVVRPDSRTLLLSDPWDRQEFARLHLRDFLAT